MDDQHCFHDDLFETNHKENVVKKDIPYNAKICHNEWFVTCDIPEDYEGIIAVYKSRADLYYLQQNYEKALECYQFLAGMPLAPVIRRDVLDGNCRCLTHLGRLDEALHSAESMVSCAQCDDHKLQALLLLVHVHQKIGNLAGELSAYQKCLLLTPSTGSLWLKLATCYKRKLQLHDCKDSKHECGDSDNHYNLVNNTNKLESGKIDHKQRTMNCSTEQARFVCLLNARVLLKSPLRTFHQDALLTTLSDIDKDLLMYGYDDVIVEEFNTIAVQTSFTVPSQYTDQVDLCDNSLFEEIWFSPYKKILFTK